jgi:hypothetical protein
LQGWKGLKKTMEPKSPKFKAAFKPRTVGVFVFFIIIISFSTGTLRQEMVLTLTGAVFLAIWVYCLVMILLLALFHFRRAHRISIRLSPEKIVTEDNTQVIFLENTHGKISRNKEFLQMPGILIRCRILLGTRDGRFITYDFKPENKNNFLLQETFQAKERGAYYSAYDEFAVFDIFGFFRFAYRVSVSSGKVNGSLSGQMNKARLLVSPLAAGESIPARANSGETDREGPPLERADDLIDHRPYVPGDDPRRINWKLYSHGGELFVRQGEREPPPHSNLTLLIDTQYDSLYTAKSARKAVDVLCENALAIVNDFGKEKNIQIGYTGQSEKSGVSLAHEELGYPWANPSESFSKRKTRPPVFLLPAVPENRGIIILALPRVYAENSALEQFISNNVNREMELIFICIADEKNHRIFMDQVLAAEICAALYNKRPCVRARVIGVS